MNYEWIPGRGPSTQALARMRAHFPKPAQPMGEAWFMSAERKLYTELVERPIAEIPIHQLQQCLWEISSGTKCFGHLEEWDTWFKYLLPDLIIRSHESYAFDVLLESTVSAFMNVFWKGLDAEYLGFREDVFDSLFCCLMKSDLWGEWDEPHGKPNQLRPTFLVWETEEGFLEPAFWDAGESYGALSALLFFSLKYLSPVDYPRWLASLFAIEDPFWQGALMVWLLGAYDLLSETLLLPDQLAKSSPRVIWDDSGTLGSTWREGKAPPDESFNNSALFLPKGNNLALLSEIQAQLMPERLLQWEDAVAEEPLLKESLLNTTDLLFYRLSRDRKD